MFRNAFLIGLVPLHECNNTLGRKFLTVSRVYLRFSPCSTPIELLGTIPTARWPFTFRTHPHRTATCPSRSWGSSAQQDEMPELSCQACSERKVRCDKRNPCSTCQATGVVCVPIQRKRLPRGRHVKENKELRERLARLESLIASDHPSSQTSSKSGSISTSPATGSGSLNWLRLPRLRLRPRARPFCCSCFSRFPAADQAASLPTAPQPTCSQ